MSLTQTDLNQFHSFATTMLENGRVGMSLEELVAIWRSACESREANAAIQRALAEVDAGQHRSLDDFMEEFRKHHNISPLA